MGIWSEFLFSSHPNIIVDIDKISECAKERLSSHGLFTQYSVGFAPLEDIMKEMYDTAKVYGYFDPELTNAWFIFLNSVENQHPDIEKGIVLYFYCSDNSFPY